MKKWTLGFCLWLLMMGSLTAITTPNPIAVFPEQGLSTYSVYCSGWSGFGPDYPYVEVQLKKWNDYTQTYENYDTLGVWPSASTGLWYLVEHGVSEGYYIALVGEIVNEEWVFSEALEFAVGRQIKPPVNP